jgi:hypothetical protein
MDQSAKTKMHLCLMVFGVVIGVVGLIHGGGTLMQGSAIVEGHSPSALPENWPNAEFYELTMGSPVYTILTGIQFRTLGLLAVLVSTALIVFSLFYLKIRNGILIFTVLLLCVFLFGAGRGTPVAIGIPLICFWALSKIMTKKKTRSETAMKYLSASLSIAIWLHVLSWVVFFPGFILLSNFGDVPLTLFVVDFVIMPITLLTALICSLIHDNSATEEGQSS